MKSKKKKTSNKPAKKKQSLAYKCRTCGLVTTMKGHLCTPITLDKVYTCEFCGVQATDPRHVCKPKIEKLNYVCNLCGRVSAKRTEVCSPKKV